MAAAAMIEAHYLLWHQHIATLRPAQCQLGPDDKKLVVAILRQNKSRQPNNTVDDFLWINCKTKTTIAQVSEAYRGKHPNSNPFSLCHLERFCNPTEKLKDVASPVSGVLTLRAVDEIASDEEDPEDSLSSQEAASINTSEAFLGNKARIPLLSTTPNIVPNGPNRDGKGQFVEQNEVLQENARPFPIPTDASTTFRWRPYSHKDFPNSVKTEEQSASPIMHNRPSLPSIDTIIKTLPPSEPVTAKEPPPAWLQPLVKPVPSSPPDELPSTRIPNQKVNQPFLRYLDHYYRTSPSVKSLPLATLVDHVWSLWQSLPEKSAERNFFISQVVTWLRNSDHDPDDESFDSVLDDTKPEVPQEAVDSQQEEPASLLDFKADFGEIEKTETQASQPSQPTQTTQADSSMRDIMNGASAEELETFVTRGVTWLDAIKTTLETHQNVSKEAANWLKMVEQIKGHSARTKTVIGVVGNTGAGKSSVINALLDEEQLLPTNTMRACTAVVTEIAYNFEEGKAYRAEIEFVDEKSWQDELGILFHDLINSKGEIVSDATTPDSDAGIAYAKIKAVYPKKTREDIAVSSIPNLIKEVSHILGKTQKVQDDDSLTFYKRLQKYIDSQEKVKANASAMDRKAPREMEFWPLIKVVRIYCKSDALATGATIVDLPGVHDANAARAAVAEGYMKQCSGLWIVAPIIRAVDDKAAKNLLGQTFKRQLKMDGGFSQVSFICSKTDDISLMEATASLGLDEVNGPLWAEADRQSALQQELKSKIKEYSTGREALGETMEALDTQVDTWEALENRCEEDDEPVYAPVDRKRKSSERETSRKRKQKRRHHDSDDDNSNVETDSEFENSDSDGDNASEDDAEVSIRKPLTLDDIKDQLASLKEQIKRARKERSDLNRKIKECKDEVQDSVQTQRKAEASIAERCIAGRNDYSKEAIRQDFAAGVRELDQEKAQDEDEANFDPEEEARDYDEVARSLPVFCVSSRGYQQLSGRLKKDTKVAGFTELDQTEVPALQKHCKQLTVAGRTAACKKFLVAISHLANSLSMWAASDGTANHLTVQQKENERKFLSKSLGNLDNALERLVNTIYEDLKTEMQINIFDKFDTACEIAENKATETSTSWGHSYHWGTYKAVCRREGAYTNAGGPIEFNVQLAEPMMVHILSSWERLFAHKIPNVLQNLKRNLKQLLKTFHSDVSARAQLNGIGAATLPVLEQQLANYEHNFEELSTTTKTNINQAQRDINREFTPSIKSSMNPGYVACVEERGKGSYMRMKGHMHDHVSTVGRLMFRTSCAGVEAALKRVMQGVKEDLGNASDSVFDSIQRDYRSALSGGDLRPGEIMPKWQRSMRKTVANLAKQLRDYLAMDTPPEELKDTTPDDEAAASQLESDFTSSNNGVEERRPPPITDLSLGWTTAETSTDEDECDGDCDDEDCECGHYNAPYPGWEPWHDLEEVDEDEEEEDEEEE